MIFFETEGIVGLVLFAFWVWCLLDVIAMDGGLVRNLPKGGWLFVVLILPDIGGIAWVLLGRPERAGWRPGDTAYRKPFSTRFVTRGPEDGPGFARGSSTPPPQATIAPSHPRASQLPPSRPNPSDSVTGSPADQDGDARRAELKAREDELRKRELDSWEADLKRREDELRRKEGGPGLYGGGRW